MTLSCVDTCKPYNTGITYRHGERSAVIQRCSFVIASPFMGVAISCKGRSPQSLALLRDDAEKEMATALGVARHDAVLTLIIQDLHTIFLKYFQQNAMVYQLLY